MKKQNLKKNIKRATVFAAVILLVIIGVLIFTNWKIPHNTSKLLYTSVDNIPPQKTVLVLGVLKEFFYMHCLSTTTPSQCGCVLFADKYLEACHSNVRWC